MLESFQLLTEKGHKSWAHTHREFRTEDIPLAYLISFRAYGTWLHGDRRGSVGHFHNRYGTLPNTSAMTRNTNNRAITKRAIFQKLYGLSPCISQCGR
jgi:hypothetical protein